MRAHPAVDPPVALTIGPSAVDGAVLLVEDRPALARAMQDELQERGFTVLAPAATIDEARALLQTTTPAVAVLDVNLGDEQVYPLIPELREAGVPIVLLTGHDAASIPGEFADLSIMTKPVDLDDLDRFLRRHASA